MFVYIFPGIIVLIIIMYLIAIMPRTSHKQQAIPFIGKYYAHRGLHDNNTQAPENSMEAFFRAVEKGYGIELDVQLTKDKIPVVFHDYSLKRVCGVDKKVRDLTFEELSGLRLYQSKERVPKLEGVLKIVEGRVPLIVELKVEWDSVQTCESTNEVLKKYKGRYCIESFSPFALIWYKKNQPDIIRGQLATDFIKEKEKGNKKIVYWILQNLLLNFISKPDFIAYEYKYASKFSFLLATKLYGAIPFAWTIKSQAQLEQSRRDFVSYIFDSFTPRI